MQLPSYLQQFPEHLRNIGSHTDCEIELRSEEPVSNPVVYSDKYVMLVRDPVIFPNGNAGTYLRLIETPVLSGAAGSVIVPIVDGCVVFVEIFRHATRSWEWELPRGFQEQGITVAENAMKETEEEISIAPQSVESLGPIAPNTGILAGVAEAFVAVMPAGSLPQMRGEAKESIRSVRGVAFADLDQFILQNVRCGFSMSAILLAKIRGKI